MPTNRTYRRRLPVTPDAIKAVRENLNVDYSPTNYDLLLGCIYFQDHTLSPSELARARLLLDAWRAAHEAALRAPP